ncbi:MAG TPA: hypothetical protein VIO59_03470 [Rhodanobacter sp.]
MSKAASNLVASFPTISEPVRARAAKAAPTTVAEYVAMASPAARAALIAARDDIPGTAAGLARYERRKAGDEFPEGRKDGAGRWYPSDAENGDDYTSHLRSPSRAWPWSLFKGAFTLDHCLALDGGTRAGVSLLRKKVRGVALVDLLAADRAQPLAVVLDRAVLHQVVGIDDAPAGASQRRAL